MELLLTILGLMIKIGGKDAEKMKSSKKIKLFVLLALIFLIIVSFYIISYGESVPKTAEERLENAVVIYVNSSFALVHNEEKRIDSEDESIVPFVQNGRTLVPVRFISEAFGADVSWDSSSETAVITIEGKKIELTPDRFEMTINQSKKNLEVPARIISKRLFVPLRAVGEALEKEIFYDRGLIIISHIKNIFDTHSEKGMLDHIIERVNKLPDVGTKENLIDILKNLMDQPSPYSEDIFRVNALAESAKSLDTAASNTDNADYSATNVQVEGVDEADIVKTDGTYIYQINEKNVIISKVYPAKEMGVVKNIHFDDPSYDPREIYVDDKNLIVIGHTNDRLLEDEAEVNKAMYPYYFQNRVKAYIYNIEDKENITPKREVELEGRYVSSRKIGDYLYMVTNCYATYRVKDDVEPYVPSYKDTVISDAYIQVPYSDIKCIPPVVQPSYLMIGALSLNGSEEMQVKTYLGAGDNIYASKENLYMAISTNQPGPVTILRTETELQPLKQPKQSSLVYKFSMEKGKVTYLAKGEVPGRILNQFSMDEYKDHFRIATTCDNWSSGQDASANNVYILDDSLNLTGKIEDIAPGEKIYSVRYMGDRAYMVTFKTVDPLFVLDLKDPKDPKILGALKIPGYSDYLHPYDENHIIGFGKDTVELPVKDWKGNESGTRAYYLGMKIALFDVSDVHNPVEKFNIKIGDRGTDSELLDNHKALLFDKKRNLLAFPVTVREVEGNTVEASQIPQYGKFKFQGAYVYELTAEAGFDLKGKMTHRTSEDDLKAGYYDADRNKKVQRILYINDLLYAVSNSKISAHEQSTTDEIQSIDLK